nr:RNA polymerase beta'' subunit [Chaetopeltis orbicularis]
MKLNSLFSNVIYLRKNKSKLLASKNDPILLNGEGKTKCFSFPPFLFNSNKDQQFSNHFCKSSLNKVMNLKKNEHKFPQRSERETCFSALRSAQFLICAKSYCVSSDRRNKKSFLKVLNNNSLNTPDFSNNQSQLSQPTLLKRSNFSSFLLQEKRMINTLINQSDSNSLDKKLETFAPIFWNLTFDKGRLKSFISWYFKNYGQRRTLHLLEKLKTLGFGFATKAGISLGVDDLQIPPNKKKLLAKAEISERMTINLYKKAEITSLERFQTVIETWNNTSELLKDALVLNFKKTDILNPVFMMAFSGARGNISQVRQLAGMRGLMADPQGQILDFPIQSNFREGLTLTEYVISCYGARKGVVDTALRTADAGYLTRRLVDVAHQVIVSHIDCGTKKGIFLTEMKSGNKSIFPLNQRLLGRVLAADVFKIINFKNENGSKMEKIANRNTEINEELASFLGSLLSKKNGHILQKDFLSAMPKSSEKLLQNNNTFINFNKVPAVYVRSPLTCQSKKFICQVCYGWSLADGHLVSVGEAVGIIAAQSIGEPGTQLTMRTFHTGGVFAGEAIEQIKAPFNAIVEYLAPIQGSLVRTPQGDIAFLTKGTGELILKPQINLLKFNDQTKKDLTNKNNISYKLPSYSLLFSRNKENVTQGTLVAQTGLTPSYSLENLAIGEYAVNSVIEGEMRYNNVDIVSFLLNFKKDNTNPFERHDAALRAASLSLTEQKQETVNGIGEFNDLIEQSLNWGYVHVLAGKIVALPLYSDFFPEKGDLVDKTSSVSQIHWVTPLNCYLSTNFLKKKLLASTHKMEPPKTVCFSPERLPLKIKKNKIKGTNIAIFKSNFLKRLFTKNSKLNHTFTKKKRNKILIKKSNKIKKNISLSTIDLTSLHKTFLKSVNLSTKYAIKNKIDETSFAPSNNNFLSAPLKYEEIQSEKGGKEKQNVFGGPIIWEEALGSLQTWRQHSKASQKHTFSYKRTKKALALTQKDSNNVDSLKKEILDNIKVNKKLTNNTCFFRKLNSLKKQSMVHNFISFDRPIIYLPIKKTFYKGFGYIFSISTLVCEHKKTKPQQNYLFLKNKRIIRNKNLQIVNKSSHNSFINNQRFFPFNKGSSSKSFVIKNAISSSTEKITQLGQLFEKNANNCIKDVFFAPLSLASSASYNFKKEPLKLLKLFTINETTSTLIKENPLKSANKLKSSFGRKTKKVKSQPLSLKKELSSGVRIKNLHKSRILQWFASQYQTLTGGLINKESFDLSSFKKLKEARRALVKPVKELVYKKKKTSVKSFSKKRKINSQKKFLTSPLKSNLKPEIPFLKLVPILKNKQKIEQLSLKMTRPSWFFKKLKVKESIFFKPRIYWSPQEIYNLSFSKNNKIYYNNTLTNPFFVLANSQRDLKLIDCFKTGHIQFFQKSKQNKLFFYKEATSISPKLLNKYLLKKELSSYSMYSVFKENRLSKTKFQKPLKNVTSRYLAKKNKKKISSFSRRLNLNKKLLRKKSFAKSYFLWGISQLISNKGQMSIPLLVIKEVLKALQKKQLKKTLLQLIIKKTSLIKALKVLSLVKELMIPKKERSAILKGKIKRKLNLPVQKTNIGKKGTTKKSVILKNKFKETKRLKNGAILQKNVHPFLLQKRLNLKKLAIENGPPSAFSSQSNLGQPIIWSQVNPRSKQQKRKQKFKKANANLNISKSNKSILNKKNKLLVKPGWIYSPKNINSLNEKDLFTKNIPYLPLNISCHKKYILPGQKFLENIQFDQRMVYAEFILTSLNNNKPLKFFTQQAFNKINKRKKGEGKKHNCFFPLSFVLKSKNTFNYWYTKMQKQFNKKNKTILPLEFRSFILFSSILLKKRDSETDPLFLFNDNKNHTILTQESFGEPQSGDPNTTLLSDNKPFRTTSLIMSYNVRTTVLKDNNFNFSFEKYINKKETKQGLRTKQTKIVWIANSNSRFNPTIFMNNCVKQTLNKEIINNNNSNSNFIQRSSGILNLMSTKKHKNSLNVKKNVTSLLSDSFCSNKKVFLLVRKVIEYPTVNLKKYKNSIYDKFSNKIHQLNNSVLLQSQYVSNFLNKQKPTLKLVSNFPNIDFDINAYSKIDLLIKYNKQNHNIKNKLVKKFDQDLVDHSKFKNRKENKSNLKIGRDLSEKSIFLKKEAQKNKKRFSYTKLIGLGLSSFKKSSLAKSCVLNNESSVSWKNINLMEIFIEIFKNPLNNSNKLLTKNHNNNLSFLKNKNKTKNKRSRPNLHKKPTEIDKFKQLMYSTSPFLISKVYFNNNQNPPLAITNQRENLQPLASSKTFSDFERDNNSFSVVQNNNILPKKVQKSLILKMLSNFIFKTKRESLIKERKITPLKMSDLANEFGQQSLFIKKSSEPFTFRKKGFFSNKNNVSGTILNHSIWSSLFSQPCIHWNFTQNMVFGTEFSFVPLTKRRGVKKVELLNENLSLSSLKTRPDVLPIEAEFFISDNNYINAKKPFVKTHFLSPCFGEIVSNNYKKQKLFSFYQKNRNLILTPENLFSSKLPVDLFKPNSNVSLQNSLTSSKQVDNYMEPKHTFSYMNIGQFVFKGDSLFLKANTDINKAVMKSEQNADSLNINISKDISFSFKKDTGLTNKKSYRIGIISDSGQIVHINSKKVTIRRAQPIFFSGKCIFHIQHRDFVQKNRPVLSLPYLRVKTGDIVQGIPKIEQLFEGRTSFGGEIEYDSLPNLLKIIYQNYRKKLPLAIAVQKSIQMIRCVLVNSIQRVYRSQGVSVSDKHIEVIVKQMTLRVRITYPGTSGFFRGESVELRLVLKWNSKKNSEQRIRYEPIIQGITKASLQADSFLSAASFQYTNRVLKDSAFQRKIDFLNGLKENIIIGNLIPVGTGFFSLKQIKAKKVAQS